ncbi:chitobiase/beta-hexosaminidase C-terminal domain-containing protein [Solimonas marina]|uniref:GH29D-like beta-sandwich domain-containing protein n=1 Tax=Solimonas marina TaxID=2714601 RepID=A0A969WFT4_9GAMM|nr:hypothetical protein [Solimonas marina]
MASAQSATFTPLYTFSGGQHGATPRELVVGSDGNFYGTTTDGGASGQGSVFKLTPAGTLTTLYSFTGGADGASPYAGLVQGSDGTFYGTTDLGGTGYGTVFSITASGVLTTLHRFAKTADGASPAYARLLLAPDGMLYGTTSSGGGSQGTAYGTAFKLAADGTFTTLHTFINNGDGQQPLFGLTLGADGAFYGTTNGNGTTGTAFRITSDGTFKTLYAFGTGDPSPSRLTLGSDGKLYGASGGGAGYGAIFSLQPDGVTGSSNPVFSRLYSFTGGADGAYPGGLSLGDDPRFYGVTSSGGSGYGTVFRVAADGTQTTLYTFDSSVGDGNSERSPLVQGSDGAFYGSASQGGANGLGLIYKIVLPAAATPSFDPVEGTYVGTQSVTITDSTDGASLYYTTDGSAPTTDSTQVTGPISISETTTLKAIAVASGYSTSAVATASYTIESPAATPTFSPAAGTYTSAQSVTISDRTPGATIHYTVDGSTPTAASTTYSAPITVSQTTTIKAMAVASGYGNSAVASAQYTITPPAEAPSFSPAAGTYTTTQSVTLSSPTTGAKIHFTIDGSTPTATSPTYSGPISVSESKTIKAITVASGYADSSVATAKYTITPPADTPTFSPAGGTYTATQSVTISDSTTGATIHFTTDGSQPTANSSTYTGPISVTKTTTLKAIAVASGHSSSAVATATYTIETPAAAPTFSPAAGTYTSTQSVTISDSTDGATIHYSIDGSTPTSSSATYTGPITVSSSVTLKAIAVASGHTASAVASAPYTITAPAATPTFSPSGGTYTSAQSVTISSSTSGAVIRYTTDGSTPNANSAQYAGPITVSSSLTLKAIATASGYSSSAIASATYSITPPAATPSFSPGAGTYQDAQSVTISDSTPGATIYYSVDGSQPGTDSTPYSGPIAIASTQTLKAVAVAPGYAASAVASARYVITPPAAAPTFSPSGGTYTGAQTVTIADTTPGASIHFTVDGSTPTTASAVYSAPLSVDSTTTIKAIATASGYASSPVSTAKYVISAPSDGSDESSGGGGATDSSMLGLMALAAALRRRKSLRDRIQQR